MTVTDNEPNKQTQQLSHRVFEKEGEERIPKGFMKKKKLKKTYWIRKIEAVEMFSFNWILWKLKEINVTLKNY